MKVLSCASEAQVCASFFSQGSCLGFPKKKRALFFSGPLQQARENPSRIDSRTLRPPLPFFSFLWCNRFMAQADLPPLSSADQGKGFPKAASPKLLVFLVKRVRFSGHELLPFPFRRKIWLR